MWPCSQVVRRGTATAISSVRLRSGPPNQFFSVYIFDINTIYFIYIFSLEVSNSKKYICYNIEKVNNKRLLWKYQEYL